MAVVELILDIKAPSFLAGNTNIPKFGEPVFLNNGKYAFGDGTTQFKDLVLFGGTSSYTAGTGLQLIGTQFSFASTNISQFTNDAGYITSASSTPPAGSTNQIQYNNAGAFGASPNLTFNPTNGFLDLTASIAVATMRMIGNVATTVLETATDFYVTTSSGAMIFRPSSVEKLRINSSGVFLAYTTPGSVPFIGTSGLVTESNSTFYFDNANTLLYLGTNSGAYANTKAQIQDNVNAFSQINYTNKSAGTSASTDYVATADTGTNTSNYVDLGINSSTFNDVTFTIASALDSYLYSNGGNMAVGTQSAKDVVFFTGGTLVANEAGRFVNGSGLYVNNKLSVGLNSIPVNINLTISKNVSGGTTSYGVYNEGQIQSTVTAAAYFYQTAITTQAAAFNTAEVVHYNTSFNGLGAGSSITVQSGFKAAASLVGATSNYGFRGMLPSAAANWNIYMDGGAQNYIRGNVGIGNGLTAPLAQLHVLSTTEQTRTAFDGSNYMSTTVASTGSTTFSLVGTTPSFTFSQAVNLSSTLNKVTITAPTTSATLTLVTGSTLQTTGAFVLNLTTTAASTPTFPTGAGTLAYLAGTNTWSGLQTFSNTSGINVTNNVNITTAGKGIVIKGGTNAKAGQATLVGGAVTVSTTAVSTTSIVIVTGLGTSNAGFLTVTITAGTSFTITSSIAIDARAVNWAIIDQN